MNVAILRPIKTCVSIALFHDDKVLLVRRAQEPNLMQWSLPGGKLENGETLEQAAKRELLEETQSIGIDYVYIERHLLNLPLDRYDFDYEIHCFAARAVERKALANSDVSEVQWVGYKDCCLLGVSNSICLTIQKAHSALNHGNLLFF